MSDFAHRKTDVLLADIEKNIAEIYALAGRELNEKIISYFAKFVKRDEEMLKMVKNGEITEQEYALWRLAQMGRGERFQTMRDDYARRVNEANQAAAAYINDNTPGIYSLNRNYTAYTIEQVCGDVGFTLYDEQTVRRLIVDKPDLFPAPRVDIPVDLRWNKQKLTAELTSGILQGESIGKLADRFQRVTDMNRTSAVRNARTAVTGAQNAGRQASFDRAEEMDLPLRKRWIATKDGRTRHDHRRADGQVVGLKEPFIVGGEKLMHPGDTSGSPANVYNCRCTMRTVEKEGIEAEPRMMRVKNPETGKYELINEMTYDEWERWKNGNMSASAGSSSEIVWPSKRHNISAEEYKALRSYAADRGIALSGFKKSDVDLDLATEAIDAAASVLERYHRLRGTERKRFILELNETMSPVDFAQVDSSSPHILQLNANAFRSKTALTKEYAKLADEGWFVKGTNYKSVIYHEVGHMIANVYGISGVDVVAKIIGLRKTETIIWCRTNISEYSSMGEGQEIIAEMFSAYFGLEQPHQVVVDFIHNCDIIISEKG